MKEPELLAKKWLHAYEEDEGGNQVFRPEGHELPMSRGRESLDLRKGAAATKSIPGPDDRAKEVAQGWSLGKDRMLQLGTPGSTASAITYEIVSVAKDRLVLKRKR